MPKYLFRASYNAEGVAGLIQEGGSARRDVAKAAVESLGGKLEAFYFAFGEDDVIGIVELPDHESMAALSLEVAGSGEISTSTTVLLTPEEMDRAREKHSAFRAPGR
jgi:uncharacterized protein with GYD domain